MQTSAPHPSFTAPICADCLHRSGSAISPLTQPQCHHPATQATRCLVSGDKRGPLCIDERLPAGGCGPDGRRFQSRNLQRRKTDTPRTEPLVTR